MFVQQKMTKKTTTSAKPVSMIEPLEGRKMFSASPAVDGVAAMAERTAPAANDISIVVKVNKPSPKLEATAMKIKFSDILISG